MSKGVLYIISGPSGTGKGTICAELVRRGDVFLSVSSTTRKMRENEIDGESYNFTDRAGFQAMIDGGLMLEWAEYNGNFYGTPRESVEKELERGRNVILEIEPQGALKVKEKMPEAVLIFITPPSVDTLFERLRGRGTETTEQIAARVAAAGWELSQAYKYNYIIENDDLELCVARVCEVMRGVREMRDGVDRLLSQLRS